MARAASWTTLSFALGLACDPRTTPPAACNGNQDCSIFEECVDGVCQSLRRIADGGRDTGATDRLALDRGPGDAATDGSQPDTHRPDNPFGDVAAGVDHRQPDRAAVDDRTLPDQGHGDLAPAETGPADSAADSWSCPALQQCGGACCAAGQTCIDEQCCDADRVCNGSCCTATALCVAGAACSDPVAGETILYATALGHDGALGGRIGADTICRAEQPARLSCSLVRALISVSASDEIRDLPQTGGFDSTTALHFYRRGNGVITRLASDWLDALDGSIEASIATGTGITDDVWTGSRNDGSVEPGSGQWNYLCLGWTSNLASDATNAMGGTGTLGSTTSWLYQSGKLQCYHTQPLLCACRLDG